MLTSFSLRQRAAAAGCLIVALFVLVSVNTVERPIRVIQVDAIGRIWTLDQLREAATVVAMVRSTGQTSVHWNSADGKEWAARPESADFPMIVRDDTFDVVAVLKGELPEPSITIRGFGGQVGDVLFESSAQTEWEPERAYMVFISRQPTPTKEGSEEAWTLVELGQGALTQTRKGPWSNPFGVEVTDLTSAFE